MNSQDLIPFEGQREHWASTEWKELVWEWETKR